jgi:hypothetical protein
MSAHFHLRTAFLRGGTLLVWAATAGALLSPSGTAAGGDCAASWTRPYICGVEMRVGAPGERRRERVDAGDEIEIPVGGARELELRGLDQWGAGFPSEHAVFTIDESRECRGIVTAEALDGSRFRLAAGDARGRCTLHLRVPGNQNLEWELRVEVKSVASEGYSREQAELIAARLYLAILARDGDPGGLAAAAAEIQRGRLSSQVEGMLRSGEFQGGRSRLPATELLDGIYAGLLGRKPDSAGVRRYLSEVEKRRLAKVIVDVIASPEFESQMLALAPNRRPGR